MAAPPAIEVRDLRRVFRNRTVLDEVDFTVEAEAVAGFLGPSPEERFLRLTEEVDDRVPS